jgi:hypothetical protein
LIGCLHILAVIKSKRGLLFIVGKYGSCEKQYGDLGWNSTGKQKATGRQASDGLLKLKPA